MDAGEDFINNYYHIIFSLNSDNIIFIFKVIFFAKFLFS